jgi:hypothetical protein
MFRNFLDGRNICTNILGVKDLVSASITRCFATGFMLVLNSRDKNLEVFMSKCLVGTFPILGSNIQCNCLQVCGSEEVSMLLVVTASYFVSKVCKLSAKNFSNS